MDITLPALILGCFIATLLGAGLHLLRGGNLGRLLLYIAIAWVGFWIGHAIGEATGWTFGSAGPLHVGMGVLVCLAFLGVGYWLSLVKK
jgi:hypothetical protein